MKKNSKRKLLFTTILLAALLISSAYASLIPNVHAAEATIQQEGLAVTSNVIGVDLTKYAPASEEYRQDSYLDVLPQENMRYTLETDGSKLDIYYTFVNGKLQKIHVLEIQGTPHMQKTLAPNSLENAKDFLSNYQDYSENTFYGELMSTLNTIDSTKNETKVYGNIKLATTTHDNSTTYKWTYTFNGIDAPDKCVALHYENDYLSYFIDNWDIYTIGSTNVNFSEQEAIDIAMAKAEDFTWATIVDDKAFTELKYNVTNAMVWQTIFSNSIFMDNQRGQDPFTLYPMRHIWVSFDKFYPCNVYGMNVYVWADTGEIGHLQERFSTVDPPADLMVTNEDIVALASVDQSSEVDVAESSTVPWILIASFVAITLVTCTIRLHKKILPKSCGLTKLHSKIGGVFLCFLIASTVLISVSMPIVNALPHYGRAHIWGSESSDAWNSTYNLSWRKHPDEVTRQELTASFLRSKFYNNGYSAVNSQGTHGYTSYKNNILSQIDADQSNYARVAVIDFDHGNGLVGIPGLPSEEFHFMFEDNVGTAIGPLNNFYWDSDNGVYDMDIYPLVGKDQVIFAFINTCYSANLTRPSDGASWQGLYNNKARGMPFAWTHRVVKWIYESGFNVEDHMSSYGYSSPDSAHQVYIGFSMGSASLEQLIPFETGTKQYYRWVNDFFYYALHYDMSVNDALDHASWLMWGDYFGDSPLWTGFQAVWPIWNGTDWDPWFGYNSRMAVYGNGNIHLKLRSLTVNSPVATADVYIDGEYRGTTGNSFAVDSGSHALQVDSSTHVFHNFTGYSEFENPITVSVTQDTTVTANYYANPPPQYTLSISAGEGGTTQSPYTPGNHQCTPEIVSVTAVPSEGYGFDHWLLDDVSHTENPISVPMSRDHELQAIFVSISAYVSSIYGYGGAVSLPENMVGNQPDSQVAGLYSYWPYGVYGWIIGTMNAQATGHIYMYGYCNGGAGHLYVYVSSDGSNWYYVGAPYVSSTSPYWIDCGTYAGTFNYVEASVSEETVNMYIDSVKVTP